MSYSIYNDYNCIEYDPRVSCFGYLGYYNNNNMRLNIMQLHKQLHLYNYMYAIYTYTYTLYKYIVHLQQLNT